MEPALQVAIGAIVISVLTLVVAITNSVFTAKSYKKSRRHEFIQRRDYLSQCISDLNKRNIEAQMISARYKVVELKQAMLPMQGEHIEQNKALIASLKEQREGVERKLNEWGLLIETCLSLDSKFNSEADAPHLESSISIVKAAAHHFNKSYSGYSATLHILETAAELTKTQLVEAAANIKQINSELAADIRQINLDAEEQKRQINLDAEEQKRQINLDYEVKERHIEAGIRQSHLDYEARKRQIHLDFERAIEKRRKQEDDS